MTSFYYCAFVTDGLVVMVGTDPFNSPSIPEANPAPDLIIAGTAEGQEINAGVLFPLASWDGTNIAIEGVTILTQETV